MIIINKEQNFYNVLKNIFIGAEIEGFSKSGYINLIKIKSKYFNKVLGSFKKDIETKLKEFPEFSEELFDKLYNFFHRYFSEIGSIYFSYTPLHQNIYEKVYTEDKDVFLFWKTHMLYYVKTEKLYSNLDVNLNNFKFSFDVSTLEHKSANEKRDILFELKEIRKPDYIKFNVIYSPKSNVKTKVDKIIKELKNEDIEINVDLLENAFAIFKKQVEVDYFINKNAKEFLKEQFNIWFYQYIFSGQSGWTKKRIKQLQLLRELSFKVINFISQFEDELVKVWNKPKFVTNSSYVITLNKIAEKDLEIIKTIINHPNFKKQLNEWIELGILKEKINKNTILQNTLEGLRLNKDFKYLPIDTAYFKEIEFNILALFDDIDNNLDGWLIKSENYQALNTILPKFKEKIQTLYLDPPFNTGRDFDYIDRFQDSTWLTLLENRISLSKEFLNSSGSIFLHLDDNANYLGKFLLNLIFNPENFRAEISYFLGYNMKREIIPKKFIEQTEIILHYSKSEEFLFNKIAMIKNRYLIGLKGAKKDRFKNKYLEFFKSLLKNPNNIDLFSDGLFQAYSPNLIVKTNQIKEDNRTKTIIKDILLPYWENEEFLLKRIFKNIEIDDLWDEKYFINMVGNIWMDIYNLRYSAINYNENEHFPTQKVEKLMARIILSTSNVKDIILDPFLGSGTTIAVAQKLNRRWVGIEMGEYFYSIILPRMKRVLAGIRKGISEMINFPGGGFFKYFELEQYEDTLRKMIYEDSDFLSNPYEDPYNQYIFLKDQKLLQSLDINYERNEVKVDFSKLYEKIDIAETLSHLFGKPINKCTRNSVEFKDGEEVILSDLSYKRIKNLIWW